MKIEKKMAVSRNRGPPLTDNRNLENKKGNSGAAVGYS